MGHISFVGILSVTQIIILAIRISHYVTLFTNRGSTVDTVENRYGMFYVFLVWNLCLLLDPGSHRKGMKWNKCEVEKIII